MPCQENRVQSQVPRPSHFLISVFLKLLRYGFPMIHFDPLSRVSNILYSQNQELKNSFILVTYALGISLPPSKKIYWIVFPNVKIEIFQIHNYSVNSVPKTANDIVVTSDAPKRRLGLVLARDLKKKARLGLRSLNF